MIVMDGKAVASKIREEIRVRVAALRETYGVTPGLAVVLIGEDPASKVYVRNKVKSCEEAGINSFVRCLSADVTEKEAEETVRALAAREDVHGVLVQLPLPSHLNAEKILSCIPPEKDADGFSAKNLGALAKGKEGIVACTPAGVMELLRRYQIEVSGKRAVVIGRSAIVGRPMALLLLNADATVTVCHSKTVNLKEVCLTADILIAAAGKAKLVTADMVKEGAVVIDVGINRVGGKLCGDVDFEGVKEKASCLTPVPGGVGPMTVAMLLKNTVEAAERLYK